MKLVTFHTKTSQEPLFGLVINKNFVVSFAAIMKKQGTFFDSLESMDSYLHNLPASYDAAKELMQYAIEQCTVRDVQWPDFQAMTGPTRCKDFEHSKGIGPFLVTPDEIDNPLALDVDVRIGERLHWKGSTSEYSAHPAKVMEEALKVFTPLPGTIIGMGTIPDCCAIETEQWLLPSDRIQITFDKIGTLTQLVPDHVKITEPSRWEHRNDLL